MSVAAGCAQRGAPPGGPVDSEAPRVLAAVPEPEAKHVAPGDTVRLTFSERMNRKTVERAVMVFPIPGQIRFVWEGTDLAITLSADAPVGELGERVVTVTSMAEDRRGNRLEKTFETAYSTGDSLPYGVIEGKLSGGTRAPARVLLFEAPGPPVDSLAAVDPVRATAPEPSGDFWFSHLPVGGERRYALFALAKENADAEIDPERDRVAFGPDSLQITADSAVVSGVALALVGLEDPGSIRGLVDGGGADRLVRLIALDDTTRALEAEPDSAGGFLLDSVEPGRYRIVIRTESTGMEEPFARAPGVVRVRPGERLQFGEPEPAEPEAPPDSTRASEPSVETPADSALTPASSGPKRETP
jgi:Bacterial Ig-like domain